MLMICPYPELEYQESVCYECGRPIDGFAINWIGTTSVEQSSPERFAVIRLHPECAEKVAANLKEDVLYTKLDEYMTNERERDHARPN
jgi:hypothetical protein